jgi:hypothetical protein
MHPMSQGLVRRCAAALLLAVLGSGFALPGLDEWLYHRVPANVRTDLAHVDQAEGCDSHAEHCIAGPTLYAPRLAAPASPGLPAPTVVADRAIATLTSDPRSPDLHSPQQPRAPPTHLT